MSGLAGELLPVLLAVAVLGAVLLGFPVAFTLAGVSLAFALLGHVLGQFDTTLLIGLAPRYLGIMLNETLVAVPLFVFMGMLLERTGIAETLLTTLGELFGNVPGGLGYAVVLVGAVLAASTGVVGATTVTMGVISLPAMLKAGYDRRLACGTICAASTLAQIIPPSTVMVLVADVMQGVSQLAQLRQGNTSPAPVSVGDLFAGALLPGCLLAGLYLLWIAVVAWRQPHRVPPLAAHARPSLGRLLEALVVPLALILAVLGSILAGIATPTESASLGALAALVLAAARGRLTTTVLRDATMRTAITTSMIFTILLGASVFSLVFRGLGGADLVEAALRAMPGGAFGGMAVCMAVMFVLGCFLDTFEILFIVLPLFGPPLLVMGLDPIWLGIMVGVNLQTSFLTPPFGATLFYLQGVAPAEIRTSDLWRGVLPFVAVQAGALAILWLWPGLATWLPHLLRR